MVKSKVYLLKKNSPVPVSNLETSNLLLGGSKIWLLLSSGFEVKLLARRICQFISHGDESNGRSLRFKALDGTATAMTGVTFSKKRTCSPCRSTL